MLPKIWFKQDPPVGGMGSYGVAYKPNSSQPLHGGLWNQLEHQTALQR